MLNVCKGSPACEENDFTSLSEEGWDSANEASSLVLLYEVVICR
jgi:hypothetical protein